MDISGCDHWKVTDKEAKEAKRTIASIFYQFNNYLPKEERIYVKAR